MKKARCQSIPMLQNTVFNVAYGDQKLTLICWLTCYGVSLLNKDPVIKDVATHSMGQRE
jgi:hypothetical protein